MATLIPADLSRPVAMPRLSKRWKMSSKRKKNLDVKNPSQARDELENERQKIFMATVSQIGWHAMVPSTKKIVKRWGFFFLPNLVPRLWSLNGYQSGFFFIFVLLSFFQIKNRFSSVNLWQLPPQGHGCVHPSTPSPRVFFSLPFSLNLVPRIIHTDFTRQFILIFFSFASDMVSCDERHCFQWLLIFLSNMFKAFNLTENEKLFSTSV